MLTRITIAGLLLVLMIGCAKKTAKPSDKGDDFSTGPQPAVPAKPTTGGDKAKTGEKPNWLTDPRVKVEKNQLPVDNQFGKPDLGIKLPTPDTSVPPPPAKGTGTLQPQLGSPPTTPPAPRVGGKPVTEADMKEIWVFMDNASAVSGKLPPMALVYSALVKTESKAADLVKDGSIILTNTASRESIWAFEFKALTQGGLVVSQNGVETLTAAELKARLGR